MKRRTFSTLLALSPFSSLAIGPVHTQPRHATRRPPHGAPPTPPTEVVLSGTSLLVAQMRVAQPTTVINRQDEFRCGSWGPSNYDEATLVSVDRTNALIAAPELIGETLLSAEWRMPRIAGFHDADPLPIIYCRKVLRTDVNFAATTWTNYKAATAWQTAGALGALDVAATELSSVTFAAGNGLDTKTIPTSAALLAHIQALLDGTATEPMLFHTQNLGRYNTFGGPTHETTPLQLVVTYQA